MDTRGRSDNPLRPHQETEREEIDLGNRTQKGKRQSTAGEEEVARKVKVALKITIMVVCMIKESGLREQR